LYATMVAYSVDLEIPVYVQSSITSLILICGVSHPATYTDHYVYLVAKRLLVVLSCSSTGIHDQRI